MMRKTKRFLAYVLAVAMVFSCFTGISLTAKASESKDTAVEIEVGKAKAVTIDTPGESYWVKFTPAETGKYVFYSQGSADTEGYLYDASMQEITYEDGGLNDGYYNFKISYDMTANETYYLQSCLWEPDEGNPVRTGEYTLHLEKATTATTISFAQDTYVGYVGENVYFTFGVTPIYAVEEYTYTVSQEGVVAIEEGYNRAELIAPGTVTLTATTKSGCTDTCTIEVREIKQLTVGDTETVEPTNGYERRYEFVPEETGTYVLYSDDIKNGYGNLSGNDGTHEGSNWVDETLTISAVMTAGESYCYGMVNDGEQPYTINLVKAGNATSIAIDRDTIEGYPGDWVDLDAELDPRFSIEDSITWASNNEEVATVNEYGEVELKKVGTAKITVTTENGLTDTCEVTVKGVTETITLDEKKTAEIKEPGSSANYAFTPEKDGLYAFYSDTKKDTRGYIYTADGECVGENDDYYYDGDNYNFRVDAELKAGETYYLKAEFYDNITGSFDVYVSKVSKPTEMSFTYSTLTGYVGETKYLNVTFGPGIVKSEGWELSSADETIVAIENGEVILKETGITKLTATSESGLTCECTVTVKEPEELTLDKELTVEVKEDQRTIYFAYTPTEDDTYTFYSTDDNGFCCVLYDENNMELHGDDGSGIGDNFKIVYNLEEGKTYTYIYEIYSDDCDSVSVKLQKATEEVTGIELSHSSINGYVDLGTQLKVNVLPANSTGDIGEVTWTSSNPEVVEIVYSSGLDCGLYFKAEGTATITVEANGYTDSCVIKVGKIPEIKVNDTKTVNIEYKQDYEVYMFTPEKDGTYVFSSTNAASPVLCVVLDAERYALDEDYGTTEDPNVNLELKLKAGETYTFMVGYASNNKTGTFTVTLIDKDNPPVVTPDNPSDNTNQTTNNNTNNQNTTSPVTGDMQVSWTWAVLMMAAVVAVFGTVVYRKKKSE